MSALSLSLLGPFHARRNGQALSKFRTNKVQALLIYLAVESAHAHRREALVELLWPGLPPKSASENLRQTLYQLRKVVPELPGRGGAPVPFLLASRQTIQINPEADVDVDAVRFGDLLRGQPSTAQLAQAAGLYRGDFLADFYLPDSGAFEDWAGGWREALRRQALDALDMLAGWHLERGDHAEALDFARRQLEIDSLRESAHRQVMAGLLRAGQRAEALAQYETCRRLLADELGVEPAAETRALADAARQSDGGAAPAGQGRIAPDLPHEPAFLLEGAHESPAPVFVGRERELEQLNRYLEAALAGEGRVAFVTGEAGHGKTALMTEFARRAQQSHADLLVASGNCSAFSGLGDPYLPFRELLSLLAGDVEARWTAGAISPDHARRLWQAMPLTAQALMAEGPDLLDSFVSHAALAKRLAGQGPDTPAAGRRRAADLGQAQLFEQYTSVLRELAAQRPLLLMVDDLQWADGASISLLFHLGRRLAGSRILIAGAYRLSDVALGRAAEPHPLRPVVSELARTFGKVHLDLGQLPLQDSRAFVDALLDQEPNRLGEPFRSQLFERTKGQPLFTVELLRDMRERGDVVRDEHGQWVERAPLDWGALPARVEAVVEQRLERLDDSLRELLTAASVEGEGFCAQVLSRVLKREERQVLRHLSHDLEQRHRLVRERDEVTIGRQRLSRYWFAHVLFQQFLYNRLSPAERRLMHGDVARALEALCAEGLGSVAPLLAHHYVQAGEAERAVTYLLQAGDRARTLYAHQEAIDHYQRALQFLKQMKDDERAARTLMKLGLAYNIAFDFERARQAYTEGFALWQRVEAARPAAAGLQTLRVFWIDPTPRDLDPTLNGDNLVAPITMQLYSGLVAQSPEMEVIPDVARRWEILEGGRAYVFHLRDDVFWSDGVRVTAHDFEYTFKRALDPATRAPCAGLLLYAVKGARDYHEGRTAGAGQVGVTARDDHTLIIELEEPSTYFIQDLTYYVHAPVPRHAVEAHGSAWTEPEHIVTNGPFRLAGWQPGQEMVLERNPRYHGRFTGNLHQVQLVLGRQPEDQPEMYAAGEIDLVMNWFIPGHALDGLRQSHPEEYVQHPLFATLYLLFDSSQPPFDDRRVRQALVMALDRAAIAGEALKGYEQPATGGLVPLGMPGHGAGIGLPFDPERARALLAEAGFTKGRRLPPPVFLTPHRRRATVDAIRAQWAQNLGVEAKVLSAENWTLRERNQAGAAVVISGWSADYADPDNFLRVDVRVEMPNWREERYDALLEQARSSQDQSERMRLYQQADRILVEEAVLVPLTYSIRHILLKPWVRRYPLTSIKNSGFWKDVLVDPHPEPAARLQTLRTNWREPETLDPARPTTLWSVSLIGQLFSGLAALHPELDVVPDMARSWEVLAGGREYVFHLREDVAWSDGRRVSAADFEYAWKRALDPRTGASFGAVLLHDIKAARAFNRGEITDASRVGVRAVDEATLAVELEVPAPFFIQLLAFPTTYPVPRWAVEAHGAEWARPGRIVSNGPFRLAAWEPGRLMLMERSPAYHGRRGNVERLEISLHEDPEGLLSQYEAGALDLLHLWFLRPAAMDRARQRHAGEYLSGPQLLTYYITFNNPGPPFDDVRVRRALALALDRVRLADVDLRGSVFPATGGFIPPGMPGHAANIGLKADLEQARRLLAEAGYPEGRGLPQLDLWAARGREYLCEPVLAQWREGLGLDVALRHSAPPHDRDALARRGPHMQFGLWVTDYADPDCFLRVCLETDRAAHLAWRSARYDSLIESARGLTDQATRLGLYRQAEQILADEVPLIPTAYGRTHVLVKPWVRNYWPASMKQQFWKDVVVEPHKAQ